MTKYITVKLTEDQAYQVINSLDNDYIDHPDKKAQAYILRVVTKIEKALAQAKTL